MSEDEKSGISWGKVVVGAAIAVGAVLLAPVVMPHITSFMESMGGGLKDAAQWLANNVVGSAATSKGLMGFIANNQVLAASAAAGAGGLIAYASSQKTKPEPTKHAENIELSRADEALLTTMALQGYAPAKACACQFK